MARFQVTFIEREMFAAVFRRALDDSQVGIFSNRPLVHASGCELVDIDTHGHAGAAVQTVWAIDVGAGAAKSVCRQARIGLYIEFDARICEEGGCLHVVEIAAGVLRRGKKTDARHRR